MMNKIEEFDKMSSVVVIWGFSEVDVYFCTFVRFVVPGVCVEIKLSPYNIRKIGEPFFRARQLGNDQCMFYTGKMN